MAILLTELVKKTNKELNAMKKEEIVTSIVMYGFQLRDALQNAKDAEKQKSLMREPNNNLMLLMLGFLGIQPEIEEYNKKPILTGYSVDNLIGQVIAKAMDRQQ